MVLPSLRPSRIDHHGLAGRRTRSTTILAGAQRYSSRRGNVVSQLLRRNFPGLLGRHFLNIPFEPGIAGRLRYRPIANAPDRVAVTATYQVQVRREDRMSDWRGAGGYQTAVDTRRCEQSLTRSRALQIRRGDRGAGDSGAEGSGRGRIVSPGMANFTRTRRCVRYGMEGRLDGITFR